MSVGTMLTLVLSGLCTVLALMVGSLRKDLKKAWSELDDAKAEIITRKNEMEVVRDVQTELKESKARKTPEMVEPVPAGDSASRLDRLNRVPVGNKD